MKLFVLVLVAALVAGVAAECPNACNGHGVCGQHDLCTCYRNWGGNNCNYRTCPFDRAFGDQVRGDFNMDGDRVDTVTLSTHEHHFGKLAPENIPSQKTFNTADGSADMVKYDNEHEGHFYAECSGRGSCDRKTGLCKCDDGYNGASCKRINCPNDCNGHGRCTLMQDLSGAAAYGLWDHDKQQACTCDPGYTGVDCSYKSCPHGNDPLTWYYKTVQGEETGEVQKNEEQWVDVWKENEGGTDPANTNVDLTNSDANKHIAGTIRLTYADEYGESWTTRPITVNGYDKAANTATRNALAQSVKDALQGIPNDVFEDVTVTASLIEDPMPVSCSAAPGQSFFHCQRAGMHNSSFGGVQLADYFKCGNHPFTNGDNQGPAMGGDNTYCGTAGTASFGMAADWSITRNGQRFYLEAFGGSGPAYGQDTSGFWKLTFTNVISTSDTPRVQTSDDFIQHWYISRVSNTGIRFKIKFNSNPGNINTLGCDTSGMSKTSRFAANYCEAYSQQHFGPNATASNGQNSKATAFFVAGRDNYPGYTHQSTCVNNTCVVNTLIDAKNNIMPGDRLRLVKTDGTTVDWHSDVTVTVRKVEAEYSANPVNDVTKESAIECSTGNSNDDNYFSRACNSVYVYEEVTTLSTFGNATNVFDIANLTDSGGGAILYIDRDGTTENAECSHRGLCDSEAGVCSCFKGYTDDNCDRQQALAA